MYKVVLAVDDDPTYAHLVEEVVESHHCSVLSASSGKAALEILERERIHLIISDVDMTGMDGITFHKRVCADKRFSGIPFVFLTGAVEPEVLHYIRNQPNVRLIHKTELVKELSAFLETNQS